MKGIVFSEFVEMVEDKFGEDMMDDLIDATNPASGGSYTTVGTYSHEELVNMVVELSNRTELPVPALVKTFGLHLADVFTKKFTSFYDEVDNILDFLKKIDNHIHVEVAKLYPDAELPEFSFEESDSGEFLLHYRSTRGFADLALGLIEGSAGYFNQTLNIDRQDSMDRNV
ncbi:MAG: heme NO-binding domain-containing protein, partial [Kangiellaceae bacterium]|nr:heme NO-binding domain-containing protein [Kangiellaceae bacterium]